MANNAEAIGRLLADSTLLKGERGLLRKQDAPAQQTPPQPQPAAAIENDSKAVAAVLLTLLDERLQASDAEMAGRQSASSRPGAAAEDNAAPLPSRVSARYAEDGLGSAGDTARTDFTAAVGSTPPQAAVPTTSPELQTFMQRFVALALGKPEAGEATARGGRGAGAGTSDRLLGAEAVNRIAVAAVLLVCLGVVIASLLSH